MASTICGIVVVGVCVVFFFKQKTAYDMRISDWSSDVCSSDLHRPSRRNRSACGSRRIVASSSPIVKSATSSSSTPGVLVTTIPRAAAACASTLSRSAERRVGKECVSTVRSRLSADTYKINKQHITDHYTIAYKLRNDPV